MTPNLPGMRKLLESKLREVANTRGWREAIAIRSGADLADTTQQALERELACRDLDRNASLIRALRAALARIADGTYGRCVECESPVSARRLAAVPWAALCLACQEELESETQDEELAA